MYRPVAACLFDTGPFIFELGNVIAGRERLIARSAQDNATQAVVG